MLKRVNARAPEPIGLVSGSQTMSRVHVALGVLAVSAVYYILAIVGTVLSVPPAGFAIIWPATAFLISVLLLTPAHQWWMFLLAVVPAHFHLVDNFQEADVPLVVTLCQITGNCSLAVMTALTVRGAHGTSFRFDSFHGVLKFILLAGLAVPAVVNALILCLHLQTGWATDFWLSWRQWMLASIFPTITIPPMMVLAFRGRLVGDGKKPAKAYTELGLLTTGLLAASIPTFAWEHPPPTNLPTLLLVPLPFLLWAAVRLGVGGTSVSLLVFAGTILASALAGRGPFAMYSPIENVLSLQVFLTTISIPLVVLAALVVERTRTEESLRQSESRMRIAAASTDTGLWQYDVATAHLWATEHCLSMCGFDGQPARSPEALVKAVHPDDRGAALAAVRAAAMGEAIEPSEFRVVQPSGQIRWCLAAAHTEWDNHAVPIRISGVFRDITRRRKAEQEAEQLSERLLTLREEERQQIADELHDSSAQHLVAIGLNLMHLRSHISAEGKTLEILDEIGGSLGEATRELRTFTYLLHPPRLASDGLCATLQRYVDGFSRRTGLKTTLKTSPSADKLPLPLQRSVLRIVQEALANVHRHAVATRVSVNLKCLGKQLHLVIRDDGQGCEETRRRGNGEQFRSGVGVPGMTARVQKFGGKLDIRSGPSGTTVHAELPIG